MTAARKKIGDIAVTAFSDGVLSTSLDVVIGLERAEAERLAGKKAGEFYTPPEVSILLAKLVRPKPADRIGDPACGSGSLLIHVAKEIGSNDYSLYGQESNGSTWALCKMNMFLHEMDSARIEWCDTIGNPQLVEDDKLMRFDVVVAMYHDQGLPVLKFSGFEQAVNMTLGLPYPRVAVDHGTALELAGTGSADPSSLFAAIATCARMAIARRPA